MKMRLCLPKVLGDSSFLFLRQTRSVECELDAVAVTWQQVGVVTDSGSLTLNGEGVPIAELKNAWTREL